MKRCWIIILMIIPLFGFSQSQRWKFNRFEYLVGLGATNYVGDIGGAMQSKEFNPGDIDFRTTMPNFNGGVRYRILERLSVRGSLTYAMIKGSDVNSRNQSRDFRFTANMFELNAHLEFSITPEKEVIRYSTMAFRDGGLKNYNFGINTYIFAGIGVAYSKPKAFDELAGHEMFVDNKNIMISIPLGLGLKYPITSTRFLGLELGGRFTTSDYIDGYSSLYSTSNDVYFFTQITYIEKIKKQYKRRKARF